MRRALGGLAFALLAFVASAACEAIVPKDLPAFSCEPGSVNSCPNGQVCSSAGKCASPCPDTPCPSGQTCNLAKRECETPIDGSEGGPGDDGSTDGQVDDSGDSSLDASDGDGPILRGQLGDSCQTTANCLPGLFCGDSAVLADAVASTGSFCTKPCCRSEECPADFACYGPGTGGTYCVKASLLARKTASGTAHGGDTCSKNADCRSGICLNPTDAGGAGKCTDTCCADANCTAPAVCRFSTVEGHHVFACAVPPGTATKASQDSCTFNSDCVSGVCYDPFTANTHCKPHCCGTASCTSPFAACTYVETNGAPEWVGLCLAPTETPEGNPGPGAFGTACNPNTTIASDCQSAFCDPVLKTCTDICCVDADCARYGVTVKCRPSKNPYYLTCQNVAL